MHLLPCAAEIPFGTFLALCNKDCIFERNKSSPCSQKYAWNLVTQWKRKRSPTRPWRPHLTSRRVDFKSTCRLATWNSRKVSEVQFLAYTPGTSFAKNDRVLLWCDNASCKRHLVLNTLIKMTLQFRCYLVSYQITWTKSLVWNPPVTFKWKV